MINCIPGVQSKLLEQRGCTQQSWASPKLSERGHVTQGPRTLAVSLCLGPGAPEGTVVARGRGGGEGAEGGWASSQLLSRVACGTLGPAGGTAAGDLAVLPK